MGWVDKHGSDLNYTSRKYYFEACIAKGTRAGAQSGGFREGILDVCDPRFSVHCAKNEGELQGERLTNEA